MRTRDLRWIPVFIFLAVWMTGLMFRLPAEAADGSALVTDGADLFTDKEESKLIKKLSRVSDKRDCDIAVFTTGDLEGKEAVDYVDDAMEDAQLGYDRDRGAVALLIFVDETDPSNREVRVATDQTANEYFSDDDDDRVIDAIVGDLSKGSYAKAAMEYADTCDSVFADALGEKGSRGVSPGWIFGDLGIGAVLALIMGTYQKSKLKTARRKSGATDYKADGGITFSVNKDSLVDQRTERKKIEKEETRESSHESGTTHTTSSGKKHGGAGRKF